MTHLQRTSIGNARADYFRKALNGVRYAAAHVSKKKDLKCRGPVARYRDLGENQEAYNLPP
jgi:hypothetical protein